MTHTDASILLFDQPLDTLASSSGTLACLHVHKQVANCWILDAVGERDAEFKEHSGLWN